MKKSKKALSLLVCLSMIVTSSYIALADKDNVKKEKVNKVEKVKIYDKNEDKIFDNLSEKIKTKKDKDKLSVIIVFNEMMEKEDIKNIEEKIGKFKIKHKYKTIPSLAGELTKSQIEKLSEMDIVKHIEYDLEMKVKNDTATYWFGADKSTYDFSVNGDRDGNSRNYTKNDVVVAVIDTGIDGNHVDLDNGKIIAWKDYVNSKSTPYDDHGHGTHVSGIIAGEGDGSSSYKGVADGSALIGIKVLDKRGSGNMSDSAAAIDWCISNKDVYGIDVINMSLGTDGSSDGTDATSLAVNRAVQEGIVVVIAAGNSGPSTYTIGSPGAAEDSITVAAMADVDEGGFNLAYFSSRGPTADNRIKPDISAPGYNIAAPEANTSSSYVSMSGTSMATPFTAGAVSLMLDANPNLTPNQVKNILMNTAIEMGPNGKDIEYGMGRLDVYEAVKSSGGYNGSNIDVPNILYGEDSLNNDKNSDIWEFNVNSTDYPISITFVMPNWTSSWFSSDPDFDIYLYDDNGNELASSTGTKRQETITFTPSSTGTYRLEVYSYSGDGNYFFDISSDGSNLNLIQNQ